MLKNLLIYRLTIFNALMLALVGVLGLRGYVWPMFADDGSYITYGIVALFLGVLVSTMVRARKTSRALNIWKFERRFTSDVPFLMRNVRRRTDKMLEKTAHIRDAANWMVALGLIGTVVGFIVALSTVSPEAAASASGTQKTIAGLVHGMGIALNTTLVGAVAALWTEVNYRMLRTATANLVRDVSEAEDE